MKNNGVKLGARLSAVYERIEGGERIADIGCDHGALACKAVAEKNAYAVAIDLSEKSLKKCEALAKRFLLSRIEFRAGDGLEPLKENEVDCVAICGLGAKEIVRILERAKFRYPRYLFVAHNKWHLLRRYCADNGYELTYEKLLKDKNHFYFLTEYRQGTRALSEKEILLGIDGASPYYDQFVKKVKKKAEEVLQSNAADTAAKENFRRILALCEQEEE